MIVVGILVKQHFGGKLASFCIEVVMSWERHGEQ